MICLDPHLQAVMMKLADIIDESVKKIKGNILELWPARAIVEKIKDQKRKPQGRKERTHLGLLKTPTG